MRTLLFALTLAAPAHAWEATVGEICTLSHDTEAAHIFLTFDPAKPLYTLAITRKDTAWTPAQWFAMRFEGGQEITISTQYHRLSDDNKTLNVANSGFGNVLNGLFFNTTALAFTQDQRVSFPLNGAAPEVQKFRDCAAPAVS
ncbi:hypothetical protein [uncultured Shimia sp.]|uniref:hypothetical protein n=1 Tax=uncultured Shimia sp. TaxID=573152 RepID=UPI00261CDF77|nr:hypothetical protein [uncultured Shimia sp.]